MNIKSNFLSVFYGVMAILLATIGLGLLIAPHALLDFVHQSRELMGASIWPHQVGIGLLLAAVLNLFCLFEKDTRRPLHWVLLLFIAGMAATHGRPEGSLWWLWLPTALYVLPLLGSLARLLPARHGATDAMEGKIKWFNPNKGFGFIIMPDEREYFVHFRALKNGTRHSLKNGMRVRFQLHMTERGEQANDVYIL
jgi:CspA family cold shock protein